MHNVSPLHYSCSTPDDLGSQPGKGFQSQFYFIVKSEGATQDNNNLPKKRPTPSSPNGIAETAVPPKPTSPILTLIKSEPVDNDDDSESLHHHNKKRKGSGVEVSPIGSPISKSVTTTATPPPSNPSSSKPNSPQKPGSEKSSSDQDEPGQSLLPLSPPRSNGSSSSSSRKSSNAKRLNSPSPPSPYQARNSPNRAPMGNFGGVESASATAAAALLLAKPKTSHIVNNNHHVSTWEHLQQKNVRRSPPTSVQGSSPSSPYGPSFHGGQLHARLTAPRESGPTHHVKEEPPLTVVTSTSLSFHQSMYRINGVRPEVISGGAVTPTTGSMVGPHTHNSNHHQMPNGTSSFSPYRHHNSPVPSSPLNHRPGSNNSNNGSITINSQSQQYLLHLPTGLHPRKSPLSRSPNSSPSNSLSSSGSIVNGHSQHSPPNCEPLVAGGPLLPNGASSASSLSSSSSSCSTSSSSLVSSSQQQNQNNHNVNVNRTPTVIMGEAGGVRTMLWSQPGQNMPNSADLANSTGNNSPLRKGIANSGPGNNNNNNGSNNNHGQSNTPGLGIKGPLSMERLWASEALNLSTGASNTINGHQHHNNSNASNNGMSLSNNQNNNNGPVVSANNLDDDDYEQPMICMICEDRATGLHYGIITCEG